MRLAIISDIHSNIYALIRAIENIEDNKADLIICLGDLVGYGPLPNETIAMIRRKNIICLKGNYDASVVDGDFTFIRDNSINSFALPWTVNELRASNKMFLESLPTTLTLEFNNKKIKFVHGSPNKIDEYLLEESDITKEIMDKLEEDILICAHTHIPSVKQFNNKLFINVGSIGKPKIGRPNGTYCLVDIDKTGHISASIKEFEYEVKRIVKDMEMLKFPTALIRSYETGLE